MNNSFETYLKNFNLLDYEPSGEKYGYVRISSKTQNCERQIEKMQELGIPNETFLLMSILDERWTGPTTIDYVKNSPRRCDVYRHYISPRSQLAGTHI